MSAGKTGVELALGYASVWNYRVEIYALISMKREVGGLLKGRSLVFFFCCPTLISLSTDLTEECVSISMLTTLFKSANI